MTATTGAAEAPSGKGNEGVNAPALGFIVSL